MVNGLSLNNIHRNMLIVPSKAGLDGAENLLYITHLCRIACMLGCHQLSGSPEHREKRWQIRALAYSKNYLSSDLSLSGFPERIKH